MKILQIRQTRQDYVATQIARSQVKLRFCKVSLRDVARYQAIVTRDIGSGRAPRECGPILCLGTRSGREVDVFRACFFGSRLRLWLARMSEIERHSFVSMCPPLEAVGRSDVQRLSTESVVGVEINPQAARSDIWTGSFDEMPAAWTKTFGIVFSNSFDQSQDPYRTAMEWKRVLRPGGYLIFCFAEGVEPTTSDPVGDLRLEDARRLFGGELLHFGDHGSRAGYSEVVLRLDRA